MSSPAGPPWNCFANRVRYRRSMLSKPCSSMPSCSRAVVAFELSMMFVFATVAKSMIRLSRRRAMRGVARLRLAIAIAPLVSS